MNTITPKEAFEEMRSDPSAILIDVRETFEFADEHAEGAQNIPLALFPLRVDELPAASRIFFICQSGGRSAQATAFAQNRGLHGAKNVSGGTMGWIQDGLPTVSDAGTTLAGSIRNTTVVIGAIVLAGALLAGGILSAGNEPQSESRIERVAAQEFSGAVREDDATLLDVRTKAEFAEGHIAGATVIDWNDPSFSSKVAELDKSKQYLVYCRSGNRSAQAVAAMREMGFTDITELSGGIIAWEKAGLPLERSGE